MKLQWDRVSGWAGAAIVVAILGVAVLRFRALDDVRAFQPRPPELLQEEAQVREALGFSAAPQFLLSHGASLDEAEQREEAALASVDADAARDVLAVSRFDPSAARRAENERLLREELFDPHLEARIAQLGVRTRHTVRILGTAERPALLSALEGEAGETHYLVAPLGSRAAANRSLRGRRHDGRSRRAL